MVGEPVRKERFAEGRGAGSSGGEGTPGGLSGTEPQPELRFFGAQVREGLGDWGTAQAMAATSPPAGPWECPGQMRRRILRSHPTVWHSPPVAK